MSDPKMHRWYHHDGDRGVLYCFEIAADATAADFDYILSVMELMKKQVERYAAALRGDSDA